MRTFVVAAVVVGAALGSCGGKSSVRPTATVVPVSDVQPSAIRALAKLTSSVVHVSGRAAQGGTSVDFTIDYKTAGDRFTYTARSTYQGKDSLVAVVVVPPRAWSLEAAGWKLMPSGLSTETFSENRIWSLVPVPSASRIGTESIDGVQATHYHYEGQTGLDFGTLAGSLIASDDATFSEQLTGLSVDYWINDDAKWPVKAVYHAFGDGDLQLTVELAQPNDTTIAIQPPS